MQVLFNVLMGHAKEIITMDTYGDNKNIIADGVPEIEALPEINRTNVRRPLYIFCVLWYTIVSAFMLFVIANSM